MNSDQNRPPPIREEPLLWTRKLETIGEIFRPQAEPARPTPGRFHLDVEVAEEIPRSDIIEFERTRNANRKNLRIRERTGRRKRHKFRPRRDRNDGRREAFATAEYDPKVTSSTSPLDSTDRRIRHLAFRNVEKISAANFSQVTVLKPNTTCGVREPDGIVKFNGDLRFCIEAAAALAIAFLNHAQLGSTLSKPPALASKDRLFRGPSCLPSNENGMLHPESAALSNSSPCDCVRPGQIHIGQGHISTE